jgi:hypothetical protein
MKYYFLIVHLNYLAMQDLTSTATSFMQMGSESNIL